MKLYKGYSPKNVNPYWIVTYKIPVNQFVFANYAVSYAQRTKLIIAVSSIYTFPELYVRIPIGVSNETI